MSINKTIIAVYGREKKGKSESVKTTSFNSTKYDRLPSIEKHFDGFFNLQKTAYEIVSHHNAKNKLLEDFLTVFPALEGLDDFDYLRYRESLQPLVVIAGNNGFRFMT